MSNLSKIKAILKSKDYRITDNRLAILQIVNDKQHVSVKEIIKELEAQKYNVNVMSIYNTLDLLVKEHILHLNIYNNEKIYEISIDNTVHLICDFCKKNWHFLAEKDNIELINSERIEKFLKLKEMKLLHYNLELHATCIACKKNEKTR